MPRQSSQRRILTRYKRTLGRSIGGAIAALALSYAAGANAESFKTLYHFTGKADGGRPIAGVAQDGAGTTLYGVTYQGGGVTCSGGLTPKDGCGTVYSLSKSGGFKLLASFSGPNGANGNSTPVLIGNTLYGMTAYGGVGGFGVVFAVHTDGSNYRVLHEFTGADGSYPIALVARAGGILYGITEIGGSANGGVLFSLTPSGTYTVLYKFALPSSAAPISLIIAPNGTLVGSTVFGGGATSGCSFGCGTVFSYETSSNLFKTLYTLPQLGELGDTPYVGSFGPGPSILGAGSFSIFSLASGSGFVPLAPLNFYTVGSGVTSGPVLAPSGVIYGLLQNNVFGGYGILYSLENGVITDRYAFTNLPQYGDGGVPVSKPLISRTGSVIGTNTEGVRCFYCGTIWEYIP